MLKSDFPDYPSADDDGCDPSRTVYAGMTVCSKFVNKLVQLPLQVWRLRR